MDNKIDTKLIVRATTKKGHIVFIGPASLNYFRWPSPGEHTYGKPFIEINANEKLCNSCNAKIRASLKNETRDQIVLVEGKHINTEEHIMTFDKSDTSYVEVCYDFRFFRFINRDEIESYETINIENKNINDLTDQEIEQANITTLSQLAPDLLEIKDWSHDLQTEQENIDRVKKMQDIRLKCSQHIAKRAKIQVIGPDTSKTNELKKKFDKIKPKNLINPRPQPKRAQITVDNNPLIIESTTSSALPIFAKPAKITKKSKGFGDTIKKFTDKLGIKQCGGCKKRQQWLNKYFPYKK